MPPAPAGNRLKQPMTYLEIDFGSGDRRTVELDKRQPVSIGQHPSNDVSIAGDDVELMHCRISWNKSAGFEVVAAGGEGVDVNGTLVKKATLAPGDVLRVGPANVSFLDEDAPPADMADSTARDPEPNEPPESVFSLKPLTGEFEIPRMSADDDAPPLTADEIIVDDPPLTADEILSAEPIEEEPRHRKKRSRSKSRERARTGDSTSQKDRKKGPASQDGDESTPAEADGGTPEGATEAAEPKDRARSTQEAGEESGSKEDSDTSHSAAAPSFRGRFRPRPQRPGDRDPVRSPFVLTLGGGALVLLLVGATFYFILGRQTTQSEFNAAQSLMDEGKFSQAINAFEDFLALHPRDPLADKAGIQMWISKIERQTSGASPDWAQALEELKGFVKSRRDSDDFEDLHDGIRKRAGAIAEGAAKAAGKTYDRNLLAVSDEAGNLMTAYSAQDTSPTDALKRIEAARRVSEASILKHEAFVQAVSQIDAALQAKEAMQALGTRRELLARYPDFESHTTIVKKLAETLKTERELVSRSDEGVDALSDDRASAFPPALSLTFHARSRTDEVSVGRSVFGVAQDCCYAVDSITGEPVWRRAIGWDSPFFPVPVTAGVPALLVFDTNHDELVLLDQQSGGLLWRQPEVSGVTGPPLVEDGQLYAVSAGGTLNKIDVETGRLVSRLRFSQPVSSPAALNDGSRLVVCGTQEVVYTLSKRPMECVAVSFLGQKPKGVAAPLLSMGALLLVAENLPGERASLHVLDSRGDDDALSESAKHVIPGHVVDTPVIRGRDLFVPSTGERVSSFTVSDEPGQPPLTEGPRYEAEGGERTPLFLATGPDRQIWMAGRFLRRLRLKADSIEPGQELVTIGKASQPLQQLGKRIFIGRMPAYSSSVTLFQTDRDELASQWQTVIGARLLALGASPDRAGLIAVSGAGDVYRVSANDLLDGGFLTSTTVRLKVPEGLSQPLESTPLADGKFLVWCGDPVPQLWIINRLGQIERTLPLPGVLQAAPVRMGSRLALPLSGRIHLIAERGSQSDVQDFTQPQGEGTPPAWRQLVAVDDTSLIAVTEAGQVKLLRQQETPKPYLAEAGMLDAGGAIDFDVAHGEGQTGEGQIGAGQIGLVVGGRVQLIDAASLEPVAEATLEGTVSNNAWISGGLLFVETDRMALHCFETGSELVPKWSIPLPHLSLSGSPYTTDGGQAAVISLQDGTILSVDAASGEIRKQQTVGQSLTSGPRATDSALVVATSDGSLIRVEAILDSQ